MSTSMGSFFRENQNINDYKKWIVCPKCKIEIPAITITITKNSPLLLIKCNCSEDIIPISLEQYLEYIRSYTATFKSHCTSNLKHIDIQAESYCIECQKLLCSTCIKSHCLFTSNHHIINREINLAHHCIIHESNITTHYCIKCNKTICSECIKFTHTKHDKKEFFEMWKEINEKTFDVKFNLQKEKFREKAKEFKKNLINTIEKKILELKQAIQVIENKYDLNEKNNNQICDLIGIILSNFKSTKSLPNYNILHNIEKLFVFNNDSSKKLLNQTNYKKIITVANDYFNYSYIIKTSSNVLEYKTIKPLEIKEKVTALLELKNNKLTSGLGNGSINIWDKDNKEIEFTVVYHTGSITDMCQLSNGQLVSCSMDSKIILYNLTSKGIYFHQMMIDHKTGVCSLLELGNHRHILSSSYDYSMILWDINSVQNVLTINEHGDAIMQCIRLTDKALVSCSLDETIRFWDLNLLSPSCSCIQVKAHESPVYSLIQLTNSFLVSGGDKMIKLWNVKAYTCLGVIQGVEGYARKILQLDEDRIISIGSIEGIIQIWNIKTLLSVSRILGHGWTILAFICLKNGKYVTGSKDSLIKIWEIY